MLERGPTDPAALRRYGRAMRHLGGALSGAGSGPERMLGHALVLVGTHALATAAGQAPKGLIAAYDGVKRDAARVAAACPRAGR
jgi:azurin